MVHALTAMQINHRIKRWILQVSNCIQIFFSSSTLTSYYDEVMEVHSSAIIRIPVRSHNQGLQISHLSLNSNYQTVFLEWD